MNIQTFDPTINIKPMTVSIGADVEGIDLGNLDDETFVALKAALHEHLVLRFPDQDLTPEQQIAFATRFGQMEVHEVFDQLPGHPEISVLEYDAERRPFNDVWHSDVTYRPEPSMASILYAKEVPEQGGDTLWRNAYAAYDALSAPLRSMIDGLTAEHDFLLAYARLLLARENGAERGQRARLETPPVVHPLVVVHPVTERRLLYVNPTFTSRIMELSDDESSAILKMLFDHLHRPEFHVRIRWRKGDLIIWDNRATQHYATSDYFPSYRRMHRITVGGDKPRGISAAPDAAPVLRSAG